MEKQIKNKLEGVTIGGSYIGGDAVVNVGVPNIHADADRKSKGQTIFLSYNWHDVSTADRIDRYLSTIPGIIVKRDVRDIGPWKSIREFMESIRQQDYAVLLVSGGYLKSKNCMFEVVEVMKEQAYADRIFLAVMERSIYDPLARAEYIKYWQKECDTLEDAISGLDPSSTVELAAELRRYKSIFSSIGEFLDLVSDRNQPDISEIEIQIEKALWKNRPGCFL